MDLNRTAAQRRKLNPDRRGYDAGRKARKKGLSEPLHVDIEGNPRSPGWIEWMKKGYYGGGAVGAPTHGSEAKVNITCRIDKQLRDKAIAQKVNRSQALEMALRLLSGNAVKKLMELYSDNITSIIISDRSVTLIDNDGVEYTEANQLEALIRFILRED